MNALEGWKKANIETFAPGALVQTLEGMAAESLKRDMELLEKFPLATEERLNAIAERNGRKPISVCSEINKAMQEIQRNK